MQNHASVSKVVNHAGLEFVRVDQPYLLVINIPHYVDDQGRIFLERLWHHDFIRHLTYLPQLVVASPRMAKSGLSSEDLLVFEGPAKHFFALPNQSSTLHALKCLPATAFAIFNAVGDAQIVHSSAAGWPYPLGWLATVFARLRHKDLLVIIESTPWRPFGDAPRSLVQRLRSGLYEMLASWTCRQADLALYTQPAYLEALHSGGRGVAYVTPATWIQADDIGSDSWVQARWREKVGSPLRLLFAGRMAAAKGIEVLLQALRMLDARGVHCQVDFIGAGELSASIDKAVGELRSVKIRRLDPVPYGASFFELIERYHALVVPSLTDEQPRILFDANARAISVIGSDTDGIRPHVEDRVTGRLVKPNDVNNLVEVLFEVLNDPSCFARMGLAAHQSVQGFTHEAMHATRSKLLAQHFAK